MDDDDFECPVTRCRGSASVPVRYDGPEGSAEVVKVCELHYEEIETYGWEGWTITPKNGFLVVSRPTR